METNGSRGGNTKTPRVVPSKYWCFTLNNYTKEEKETLETLLIKRGDTYIIGEEIGEGSQTPHLQGYVESKTKIRPIEIYKNKRIHWEKRKGTKEDNIKYCSKDGKVTKSKDIVVEPTLEQKKILLGIPTKLYKWQQKVYDMVKCPPEKRVIHWYSDKKGNTGKTMLAHLLVLEFDTLILTGSCGDCLYAATEFVHSHDPFNSKFIFIFHFTRTQEEYVSYQALESIKDGLWFSRKYESKMVQIPSPHVLVFANFEPDITKLSIDRWRIHRARRDK